MRQYGKYARRGKNGGYFPQCANRWNDRLCPKQRKEKVGCDECENTKWISLDVKKIIAHLLGTKEDGSDVIGVYPLLPYTVNHPYYSNFKPPFPAARF